MCLAIPGKILKIDRSIDPLFRKAEVAFGPIKKEIALTMVPEATEGDYVLVHVGVAIQIINEEEANKTMEDLKKLGEFPEKEEDL